MNLIEHLPSEDTKMDADGRIDAALNKVLRAAGTRLRNYMPLTQDELRKAMREVMSDEYIAWSNACEAASEYARLHAPSNGQGNGPREA